MSLIWAFLRMHHANPLVGEAKYLFPGIFGPEMINVTHWLGALAGVRGTIDIKDTPVRDMIHAATKLSPEDCVQLALGYVNPDDIDVAEWQNREDGGILYVLKAGEMLYRVKS